MGNIYYTFNLKNSSDKKYIYKENFLEQDDYNKLLKELSLYNERLNNSK